LILKFKSPKNPVTISIDALKADLQTNAMTLLAFSNTKIEFLHQMLLTFGIY